MGGGSGPNKGGGRGGGGSQYSGRNATRQSGAPRGGRGGGRGGAAGGPKRKENVAGGGNFGGGFNPTGPPAGGGGGPPAARGGHKGYGGIVSITSFQEDKAEKEDKNLQHVGAVAMESAHHDLLFGLIQEHKEELGDDYGEVDAEEAGKTERRLVKMGFSSKQVRPLLPAISPRNLSREPQLGTREFINQILHRNIARPSDFFCLGCCKHLLSSSAQGSICTRLVRCISTGTFCPRPFVSRSVLQQLTPYCTPSAG